MKYDAVVIGGGHNGLTAAAYLGKAGRKVLVLSDVMSSEAQRHRGSVPRIQVLRLFVRRLAAASRNHP
jgi:glycine/D-amino acid oxidase-like deaminating enzyme